MTTADDLYLDDDPGTDAHADEKARRAAAFAERQKAREAEKAELAELRKFKADADRRDALDKARADLNAEGPLGAFLRTYTGDPTADAIKAAVEADPDFKALVTFVPHEAEAAAAVMADNAAKMAGGEGAAMTQISPADAQAWSPERIRAFRESHPDVWNQLLAGATVPVPAATVTT